MNNIAKIATVIAIVTAWKAKAIQLEDVLHEINHFESSFGNSLIQLSAQAESTVEKSNFFQ